MGIDTAAASDPATDNAGPGSDSKMGIDDAISAAIGASETKGLSEALKETAPEAPGKVKTRVEAKRGEKIAGEEPTAEHADDEGEASKLDEAEDEATTAFEAPKHWPEADRKAFAGLPKEGQEVLLQISKNLQGGFTRKSQELSDKGRFADSVRSIFDEPLRAQLQSVGMDEVGAVRYFVSLQKKASSDPVGYAKWFIAQQNLTPDQLFGPQAKTSSPGGQQPTSDPSNDQFAELLADPAVKQLEARLSQLQGIIEGEQRQKQEAERSRYANSVNSIQREIGSFRQALDEAGQLKFPHFDQVQKHMGALMDTDPDLAQLPDGQDKLQKAYDMAVWARPDLRQGFIETEAQKRVLAAQKKQEAARAKQATGVKPAAGVSATRPKATNLSDAIDSAMSKHGL